MSGLRGVVEPAGVVDAQALAFLRLAAGSDLQIGARVRRRAPAALWVQRWALFGCDWVRAWCVVAVRAGAEVACLPGLWRSVVPPACLPAPVLAAAVCLPKRRFAEWL